MLHNERPQNVESVFAPPVFGNMNLNGQIFLKGVNEQLGHVLVGENESKLGVAVTAVAGVNLVLLGPPGAGKTNIMHYVPRLFYGLGENSVKHIPPQSDLTGKELTGGVVSTSSIVRDSSGSRVEVKSTTIEPILDPEVVILIADEANRASPLAIGAMLEALESRRTVNNTGEHILSKLEMAIIGINPRGIDRTAFPLSPAFVSRFPTGVHMGSNPNDINAILDAAFDRNLVKPDEIKPLTNFENVRALRSQASQLMVPQDLRPRAKELMRNTREAFADMNLREGIGRQAHQIVNIAGALAILGGSEAIGMGDIAQAVKFGVVARVGASEVFQDPHLVFAEILDRSQLHDTERAQWFISHNHATK